MSIRLKDLIKILSTLATITTGLVELTKQVNIYNKNKKVQEQDTEEE